MGGCENSPWPADGGAEESRGALSGVAAALWAARSASLGSCVESVSRPTAVRGTGRDSTVTIFRYHAAGADNPCAGEAELILSGRVGLPDLSWHHSDLTPPRPIRTRVLPALRIIPGLIRRFASAKESPHVRPSCDTSRIAPPDRPANPPERRASNPCPGRRRFAAGADGPRIQPDPAL